MQPAQQPSPRPLELWGGVECALVVRIGDAYRDQLERSGRVGRVENVELCAAHRVRARRSPFLWERIAPQGLEQVE